MSEPRWDASGPIIVWAYYGLDGWSPISFDTLEASVRFAPLLYATKIKITRPVEFKVEEIAHETIRKEPTQEEERSRPM